MSLFAQSRSRSVRALVILVTCGLLVVEWVATDRAFERELVSLSTIADNAIPSVRELSEVDASVGHIRREARRLARDPAQRRAETEHGVEAAFASIDHHLRLYLALPVYPGEPELQRRLEAALDQLRSAARAALTSEAAHVDRAVNEALAAADGVHAAVRDVMSNDAEQAARAATDSIQGHERARVLSLGFMLTCLVLAATLLALVERETAKHEAERDSRLAELDAFAARVAHDLKGPLSPMLLAVATVRRHDSLDDRSLSALDRLEAAVERQCAMIDALLEFARAGAKPDLTARASVNEVVASIDKTSRPLAESVAAELRVEVEPELTVRAPEGVVASIAQNLVRNALLHLGGVDTRVVTLRARREGDIVRLEVADTGPGIPRDVLVRLWKPFERGSTSAPGHGLGLATVKRLVEGHGGVVEVDTRVGQGSTFSVTMPGA
jgi:signal transduction histidine kinase